MAPETKRDNATSISVKPDEKVGLLAMETVLLMSTEGNHLGGQA